MICWSGRMQRGWMSILSPWKLKYWQKQRAAWPKWCNKPMVGESPNGDEKGNHCILYRILSPQTKQCCKSSNLKSKHPPALLCPRINFHLLPSFLFLELFHAWRKPSVCVCVCCSIHNIFQSWGGGSWAKNSFWAKYLPTHKIKYVQWDIGHKYIGRTRTRLSHIACRILSNPIHSQCIWYLVDRRRNVCFCA